MSDNSFTMIIRQEEGEMASFIVAFGGNVETSFGNPAKTVSEAVNLIEQRGVRNTLISRYYLTPAFPEGSGPDYVNGVFVAEDDRSPAEFLDFLHGIEVEFGRKRISRWGARTLDLDILSCDALVAPSVEVWQNWHDLPLDRQMSEAPDQLILPHPRIQDRAFVLVPMCDVEANWRHPVLGLTATEMRDALPKKLLDEVKPL